MNTTTSQKNNAVTARELLWLVEAAQENELVSLNTILRRNLYSDLGYARRAIRRFVEMGLVAEPNEGDERAIRLRQVVEQLTSRGIPTPPTVGITKGEWHFSQHEASSASSEHNVVARDEQGNSSTTIATLHVTDVLEERSVNGRAIASLPQLIHLTKLFMHDHAGCNEDEPGEGCPCENCTQGRLLIATIYGRRDEAISSDEEDQGQ